MKDFFFLINCLLLHLFTLYKTFTYFLFIPINILIFYCFISLINIFLNLFALYSFAAIIIQISPQWDQ